MRQRGRIHKQIYLSALPQQERRLVEDVMQRPQYRGVYSAPTVRESILFQRTTGIPLPIALEIIGNHVDRVQFNRGTIEFIKKLQDHYQIQARHGTFVVTPSLFTRTGPAKAGNYYGLNNFSWLSLRVLPVAEDMHLYKDRLGPMTKRDPYRSAIIVELGRAEIGRKPIIVITNAQATKDYYSLPWSLKKRFKGCYEKTLGIIEKTWGLPVLIPTNATVKAYLKGALQHNVPDSVLNEFYDRFCEKRGRKRGTLKIRNVNDGRKIEAEFWCQSA